MSKPESNYYKKVDFLQTCTEFSVAAVPLKRFGQEDGFGQRPLLPQLKHLSVS